MALSLIAACTSLSASLTTYSQLDTMLHPLCTWNQFPESPQDCLALAQGCMEQLHPFHEFAQPASMFFLYCSSFVDPIHLNVTVWVTRGDVRILFDAGACTSFCSSLSCHHLTHPVVFQESVILSSLSLAFESSAAFHSHCQISPATNGNNICLTSAWFGQCKQPSN